ncbi:hypothetical protein H6503_05090 [Candidatus Woesearchaeota archaeon]|nr:hypothetical protein [Candidatus Woesearchaeota archaeon]
MRHKISISIDEELILRINQARTQNKKLKSRSQVIEKALHSFLSDNLDCKGDLK